MRVRGKYIPLIKYIIRRAMIFVKVMTKQIGRKKTDDNQIRALVYCISPAGKKHADSIQFAEEGCYVWHSRKDAEEHIRKFPRKLPGYKVYGVKAEWGKNTEPSLAGPWHELLIDAPMVSLDDKG